MNPYFAGMYYKHQKGGSTVSIIPGISNDHAFVQLITNHQSYYFSYPLSACKYGDYIRIGHNLFSDKGIRVALEQDGVNVSGKIFYSCLTPLKYNIMGPFQYLPMQCRHRVNSLYHRLSGQLTIDGNQINFDDGTGYIEGDSGRSFPKHYMWIHCNDFPEKACVMASVADIPLLGSRFSGCIAIVYINGTEYRLATYLGAKILDYQREQIMLRQGELLLEIRPEPVEGLQLKAPENGLMTRKIAEKINCGAHFRFSKRGVILFDAYSRGASFEYV